MFLVCDYRVVRGFITQFFDLFCIEDVASCRFICLFIHLLLLLSSLLFILLLLHFCDMANKQVVLRPMHVIDFHCASVTVFFACLSLFSCS